MNLATAPLSSPSSIQPSFDAHGRLVPTAADRVYSQVDRRYFRLVQPTLDFDVIHKNVATHLGVTDLASVVSAADFKARCERLRSELQANAATAGLFAGVHVPFLLVPATRRDDLGTEMEEVLLPAVGRSFTASFPKYTFQNHAQGKLAGQLTVLAGTRYERLIDAHASRALCGWYFPTTMSGYAIPDQRSLVARMPDALVLSGPLEAAAALVGCPSLLMQNDNYPNLLALSAVQPADPKMFHFFEAYGWNLTYNQRSMVGAVSEYFTGGFTVVG